MAKIIAYGQILTLKEQEYLVSDFATSTDQGVIDRFTVKIPFCDSFIVMRVVFQPFNPSSPPDLVITQPDANLEISFLPFAKNWDENDHYSLLRVCNQLRRQFSNHYYALFESLKTSDLHLLHSYISQTESLPYNPEVSTKTQSNAIKEVIFSVPLPITLTHEVCKKPIYLYVKSKPGAQAFALKLEFPEWATHLHHLTIKDLINSQNSVWGNSRFPSVASQLISALQKRVIQSYSPKDFRSAFLQELLKFNLGVPLELDSHNYKWVHFHCEVKVKDLEVTEILHIRVELTEEFPYESPEVTLTSYTWRQRKTFSKAKKITQDLKKNAEIVFKGINEEIQSFVTKLYTQKLI